MPSYIGIAADEGIERRRLITLPLQPYHYKPLPSSAQSRIIILEPASDESAPLICRIEELRVESDEGFQALSYTWGAPTFTETLLVDKAYFLRITPNLRDALRRFRLPSGTRRLWVDAVCINQQDEEEKGKQIPFMNVIYRGASTVLVWLGNYPTQAACLTSINSYPRLVGRERGPGSRVGRQEHSELLMSISSLVELPWFSRRWIVQEAVLNPDVLLCCCDQELSWVRLASCLGMISSPPPDAKSLNTLLAMANLWRQWVFNGDVVRNNGIFDLLEAFDNFQCFDDRDRLFALGGLATDVSMGRSSSPGVLPLHVDYTADTESVYTRFCRDVLEYTNEPMKHAMLRSSLARSSNGRNKNNLPSWAPDWRLPATRKPFFRYVVYNSLLHLKYISSGLLLRGQYAGGPDSRVEEIFEPLPTLPLSPSVVITWLRAAGSLWMNRYPDTGLRPFWKFISECAYNTGLQLRDGKVIAAISWVMSSNSFELSDGDEHTYILLDIGNVFKGRSVFFWSDPTEQSLPHFGIGPDHIQVGDELVGAKRPSSEDYSFQVVIVVRNVVAGSATLVGDALLVLSLATANFWFPSPERIISIN
ncbi:heterokaryon incompatibility protein-domain-containing protein [Xylaria sp. FL1042]|nr:heterokaryon incompatibility protein-domain-containing protein [Xylaria sp. FL1042]